MDDGEQQDRQDERSAPLPADEAAIFAFRPGPRDSPPTRWLFVSLMWVLALAVAAAAVGAGIFVMRERQADKTLAVAAAHARASATALPARAADAKPVGVGLLQNAPVRSASRTESAVRPQPDASRTKALPSKPGPGATRAKSAPSKPRVDTARSRALQAKPKSAASRAKAAPLKAAPGKAKSAVKKTGSVKKGPAAQASKAGSYTWPRRRSDSVAERLNAARKACRARPHAPGECNLRACDVLGSADPACR